jgi:protein required for attachment to host cells
MARTLYVVAHRTGARFLTPIDPEGNLELVASLENPQGRLMNQELESDRSGSARTGVSSGLYEQHEDAHLHVATVFAREIADYLERARERHEYGAIVLVAEPRFLGIVRQVLTKEVASLVRETLAKDFHHVEVRDLAEHIARARDQL